MDKNIFQKTISLAAALLTGENVSQEVMLKRLEICTTCEKVQHDGKLMRCGVCGCKLRGDKSLINLARFKQTDKWGCKYPGGSKWTVAGLD